MTKQRKILIASDRQYIDQNLSLRSEKLAQRLGVDKAVIAKYRSEKQKVSTLYMMENCCPITGWKISTFRQ